MKDPERLSDGNDLRGVLLRSARRDVVPGEVKARHVAAVVTSAAVLCAKPAVAAAGRAMLLKASLLLGLAVVLLGAYRVVSGAAELEASEAGGSDGAKCRPHRDGVPLAAGLASGSLRILPPPRAEASDEAPVSDARAVRPVTAPRASSEKSASSARLAAEVARLDRVRAQLQGGDGDAALGELGLFHREFPAPQLGREATLLEIDALEKVGRHDRARDMARALMRAHPDSPAAKRLAPVYE